MTLLGPLLNLLAVGMAGYRLGADVDLVEAAKGRRI